MDRTDKLVMSRETIIQVFRTQISLNYAYVKGEIISVPFERIGRMSVLLCVWSFEYNGPNYLTDLDQTSYGGPTVTSCEWVLAYFSS